MKTISGKSLAGAILLAALALAGGGCSPSGSEEKPLVDEKPVPVEVLDVETRDLPIVVESVGRLSADREVTLAAEVGGVVKEYLADVGDPVKAGQILVRMDSRDFALALREAEASLASALARLDASAKAYERSKALLPRKVISSDAFDKIEAEYKTAKATISQIEAMVDIAEERIAKTRITAPFSGVVAQRTVEKGQTLGVGSPVMALVDLDSVRVKIHLAECDYVRVGRENAVSVTVEAFPGKFFSGRIDRLGVKGDERTNTFDVEILLENPGHTLKAGLSARVRITTDVIHDTVLIPQSTVLYREDRREVFVAGPDQRAELRTVKLGRSHESLVQVLEGLSHGDRLVVTGGQYLKVGDKLAIAQGPTAP